MADANTVLRNIEYFVGDVMELACYHEDWSVEELNKAWKWAKYCHRFSLQQLQRGTLDQCIAALTKRIPQLTSEYISVLLKDPIASFTTAMLENQNLDETIFHELVNLNLTQEADNFLDRFCRLVINRNISAQLTKIGEELPSEFQTKFHTDLCIRQLQESFESNRRKDALEELVKLSFKSQHSLNMLTDALIAVGTDDNSKPCFTFSINKLLSKCSEDPQSTYERNLLFNIGHEKLTDLSMLSATFYKTYVSILIEKCKQQFQEKTVGYSSGQPFVQSLAIHWSSLVNTKHPISKSTLDLLNNLAAESKDTIWKELQARMSKYPRELHV